MEGEGKKPKTTVTVEETAVAKKKRKGEKQKVTTIVTTQKNEEAPEFTELEPEDKSLHIVKTPEKVKKITSESKKTKIFKNGVIKKNRGDKEEKAEVVTVQEKGKKHKIAPETTVSIEEEKALN